MKFFRAISSRISSVILRQCCAQEGKLNPLRITLDSVSARSSIKTIFDSYTKHHTPFHYIDSRTNDLDLHHSIKHHNILRKKLLDSLLCRRASSSAPLTCALTFRLNNAKAYRNETAIFFPSKRFMSSASWVDRAPAGLKPYLLLARMDKPAGTWLLLWPCWWSIAIASPAGTLPNFILMTQFAVGAFVMRGAGCTINDLWDRDIDAQVRCVRIAAAYRIL